MIEQETRRSFSDVWQKLHPDSNEVTVVEAAEILELDRGTIQKRLIKGKGAKGRKIQVGKREYWVVEKDSLEPPYLKQRQEQGGVQEPAQREKESHLDRARRKAGLGDEWITVSKAARESGLERSTIYIRLKKGRGAIGRKIGRDWLVKKDSLVPCYFRQRSEESETG